MRFHSFSVNFSMIKYIGDITSQEDRRLAKRCYSLVVTVFHSQMKANGLEPQCLQTTCSCP